MIQRAKRWSLMRRLHSSCAKSSSSKVIQQLFSCHGGHWNHLFKTEFGFEAAATGLTDTSFMFRSFLRGLDRKHQEISGFNTTNENSPQEVYLLSVKTLEIQVSSAQKAEYLSNLNPQMCWKTLIIFMRGILWYIKLE